jgi:hypothetical protein
MRQRYKPIADHARPQLAPRGPGPAGQSDFAATAHDKTDPSDDDHRRGVAG